MHLNSERLFVDNKKLFEFVHNCIVTASQTAYISHDSTTFELLGNMDGVFIYFSKNIRSVTLFNEIQVLEKYLQIQKIRTGNRFEVKLFNDERYKNCYINHLSVIEFFDKILEISLDKYEGEINFIMVFDINSIKSFKVIVNSEDSIEAFVSEL